MAVVTTPRQVLVVDGLSETAAVLQAVFEPKGTVVQRTRTASLPPRLQGSASPDVIVVDLDQSRDAGAEQPAVSSATRHVFISSKRVTIEDSGTRFLQKPFQFPELIRAVEDLLGDRDAA